MNLDDKRKYFNLCDPDESLEPDDDRNIDFDLLGENSGNPVRGFFWSDKLLNEIILADKPITRFFTGHPGSGKTTELKRIAQKISDPEIGNFLPVFIDAKLLMDLDSQINLIDIITIIVYFVEKTIYGQEEGFLQRLWDWLKNTDTELGKAEFSIPSVGKLVFEMKARDSLRKKVHDVILRQFSRFMDEARNQLEEFNNIVISEFGRKGLVVIFDSLEQLGQNTESNWMEILSSAEKVFGSNRQYLQLPVHTVYTVPPALFNRIVGTDSYFLPMIKVYDKERMPYEPGLAAMRELVRRRLPEDIQKEILGPAAKENMDRLILWSGGYPRDMLKMLRETILAKYYPISENGLKHIMTSVLNHYRLGVPAEAFEWLSKMAKEKYLTWENETHLRIASQMLKNHIVLSYLNDDFWFDLHPAVYEIPGVRKAIENRERNEQEGHTDES
ncbi:MAG: hypothetical protein V2I97_08910 [Desulfococcaceae bacterium]|jgi:hypothetical protein|nr:hypothetical protein [Desulfococcaceae bacterium]